MLSEGLSANLWIKELVRNRGDPPLDCLPAEIREGFHVLLQSLKVVEFASYIAAPGAACMLGDWGADVIKIERPGGDAMRHAFADVKSDLKGNPTFDMDNRGK